MTDEKHELVVEAPTILVPKKNIVIDSTILSSLMACARMTDFKYNLHLVSVKGKSTSLEMGSIVHKFLEVYRKAIIQGIKRDEAIGFGQIAAREYAYSIEVLNTPEPDREWALQTCLDYCEYYKNDFWVPLEVESVRRRILYEDDEIRVLYKVKYDLICDTLQGIYPVDTKTMKQRRDTVSLNNQFMAQCILCDVERMFIDKVGFQKSLKPEERFTRPVIPYTADRLLEWQSVIMPYWVKMMVQYYETGYWPPNFTHCENKYGSCVFYEANVCSNDRNIREIALGNEFIVGEPWDVE